MVNDAELNALFDRLGLSAQARRVIRTIRTSAPSRRVGSGRCNTAFRFASRKMGLVIQAEARETELAAAITWEHAPDILEFWDQPNKVRVGRRGAKRKGGGYLKSFDYLVIATDWVGFIECKKEEWLLAQLATGREGYVRQADGSWTHPELEQAADALGLGFHVRSSRENCWPLIRNLDLLADYLRSDAPEPAPDHKARVLAALAEHGRLTVQQIVDLGDCMADSLYAMIARLDVHVDLLQHVLAEADRTYIYRDKELAAVYEEHEPDLAPVAADAPFIPRRGAWVVWDARPWRILNLGENTVTLANGQAHEELSLASFNGRLGRDIQGLPSKEAEDAQLFLKILRHASPADLADAHQKYRHLFPQPGDPPCPYSGRSLRAWRKRYDRFARDHGCGYFGLVHRKHQRGNRERKVDDAVIDIMKAVVTARFLSAKKEPFSTCLKEIHRQCEELGLVKPSAKALRFQIRQMARVVEVTEAREGSKAAYQVQDWHDVLEPQTPRHGERPFEQGHIDHTELSLQFVGSRLKDLLGKVHLTLLIDAFTRTILAFYLSFDPPSWKSSMCVLRECVRQHGRVPRKVVVDAGSDFQSEYFERLLGRMECHKVERPKSAPRAGALIERTFGVTENDLINALAGNNQALKNPRSTSASHDPRRHAIWNLVAFTELFGQYCRHRNAKHRHEALNLTSDEAMAEGTRLFGLRPHTHISYDDSFILMTLPTEEDVKVRPGRGLTVNYLTYRCAELEDSRVENTKVAVKYDPFDVSVAYFWLKPLKANTGRWVRMHSEYAPFFKGRTLKEIQIASAEIKGRRRDKKRRAIVNGVELVKFLTSVEGKEAVLRQRRRDADAATVPDTPRKSTPAFSNPRKQRQRTPEPPNPWNEPYTPDWRTRNVEVKQKAA